MAKDIFGLFAKRRAHWRAQNLKYLRYVFNDHFVLVLMFLIGFLAYQYADFLKKITGTLVARLCHCCLNIPFDSLIWTVSNICRKARPALFIGKGESGSDSSNKCGQGIFNPACSFDCFDDDAHQSTYPYFASRNTCLGACLNRY